MNEIIKLYENAGIKKVKDYYCPNCETKLEDWFGKHKGYICPNERCDYALCDDEEDFQECLEHLSYREKYPPFTAEKQINLIKWLGKLAGKLEISSNYNDTQYLLYFYLNRKTRDEILPNILTGRSENFEESLAGLINNLWQDLTEEEKQQVKEILE